MAAVQQPAGTAIDQPYLATFYGFNQIDLSKLITAPTKDLVASFLQSVTVKAKEFDELKAKKLQTDVELENAVRTSDTKNRAQKAALARQVKEIEDLRTKLNEAEGSREKYTTQLSSLQSDALDSTTETQTLRSRVESLEHSNRDTLALIQSHSNEKDRVQTELEHTHSKVVELRKDISKLEEQNRILENQTSSQKFKEQSLKQQLDLLKNNNERQAEEVRTTSAEQSRLRKERNARINTLERERDDAVNLVDTLRQTEASLRQRFDELQHKTEDAYTRNAAAEESRVRSEQTLQSQIDSSKRLAELHAQNAATHKARLEELQSQIDGIRDDAAEEIGRLQIDVEAERADKAQAEKTIAELELRLEQRRQHQQPSAPSTPHRNGNTSPATVPGSAQKLARNLTNTQLYTNFVQAKQELEAEERRSAKLQATLDELLHEMESHAPELLELRQEQDRLETEVLQFSKLLDEANSARDAAARETQQWQEEGAATAREADILRQQLRDVSAQVKILLVELRSKDQGLGEMSVQERLELERVARGDSNQRAIENDTQQWISERLVIFRNVEELQGRNEDLLRVVRQLGDKMEGEEAQQKARQSAAYASENDELRKQVVRYKDEMQSTALQIDSYMKERDMFRRMLQHRGTIAPDTDMQAMFGSSIMPATPQRNGIEPPTPRSKDAEDLNKLLKEQQKFFDEFRNESAVDRRTLREQVDNLSSEKNTLQRDFAHAKSQLSLASDRYDLLQSNYNNLRTENSELQKRTQTHFENASKQDLRTQQVAEELVEARSQVEALQNEKNNSKAERELWKRLEDRLTDDNKNLMDERTRLSKLNVDLSNLINERERDANEARRRLQSQAESLEAELADIKRKLDNEVESAKKAVLRKDYEETQSRTRIDDLSKSLGYTREELAAAKTARDQLQSRVDEMKIELRAAEEKAAILQPRPSTRADTTELAPEQRLAVQLSDARRDLDFSRSELEGAQAQIEQYKSIAQTTEEELASFHQTSEQYREEADAQLAEKDAAIKQLEQRVEDLTSELTATNSELSDLRTQHDEASQSLATQQANLEAELGRLTDDAERHDEEKRLYQEDLKAQAEIAQQAQQSYETELVKHAEAARGLQATRQELNTLRIEVAGIRSEAEAAKAALEHGQESWTEQKESLQREINELNQRRIDLAAQNKVLHQQLETFSTELQALRRGRAVSRPEGEDGEPGTNDGNLQEVITFLRREKDIVEVQHELAVQEGQRMQQQLTYANGQLDELHAKLADERRQHSEQATHEASTSKLAQTINELNLFRESSVTLRNEARQARERFEDKNKQVERLLAEMQPLHARLGELEADIEVKDSEIKLITTDRDHWRDRTQNIISKYDRVDPAELEELKSRLETLQSEKEQLVAEQVPLKEQIEAAEKRITETETTSAERLERFKEQAKQRNRDQNARLNELRNDLTAAQTEQARLTTELESAKEELAQSSTPAEVGEQSAKLDEITAELDAAKTEQVRLIAQLNSTKLELGSAREKPSVVVQQTGISIEEAETLRNRLAEADAQASERIVEVEALQSRITELEQQIEALTSDLAVAQVSKDVEEQGEVSENDALAQAQQDLTEARQEIARLRTDRPETSAAATEAGEDVASQVAALRSELQEQHELALKQMQEAADAKISKMKSNLARQLTEQKAQLQEEARAALMVEHSAEMQKVRDEHEQQITRLKEAHAAELERLKKDADAASSRHSSSTTIGSGDGDVNLNTVDITEEQVNELMKTNKRVRTVMQNSVRKTVAKETEKLSEAIAAKDVEIAKLKESSKPTGGDLPAKTDEQGATVSEAVHLEALEKAKQEKEAAVKQAMDNAEKKAAVQLSQRNIAQAKILVVSKAATETPTRAVAEVWEEAKKAKPAPKPVTSTPSTLAPKQQEAKAAPVMEKLSEEEARKKARAERFGMAPADSKIARPTSQAAEGDDEQTSKPNPEAETFVPGGDGESSSGQRDHHGSGIPMANSTRGRGGRNWSIQGAAARGGGQGSGIARGAFSGRGGTKRPHDGSGGGDGKRARGGGGG